MSIWAKSGLDGVYVYPFDCYDYSSTCGANKLKQSDLFNYVPCDCFLASSRFLLSHFPVGDTLLAKTLVLRVFHAAISFTVIGESLHNRNKLKYPYRKRFQRVATLFLYSPQLWRKWNYALITTCLSVQIGLSVPGLRQDERFKSFFKCFFMKSQIDLYTVSRISGLLRNPL